MKQLFYPHDTEEILKIHIQSSRDGDFLTWHFEKNGLFSVRSAYKLMLNLKDCKKDLRQTNGVVNGERRLWVIIWKANAPQNIKIFAWRAASNSLAVHINRVSNHQTDRAICSICGVR